MVSVVYVGFGVIPNPVEHLNNSREIWRGGSSSNASGRDQLRYSWGLDGGSTGTFYRLTNRNSGKVVDVSGASSADGANVLQWTWNGGTNQQWSFNDAGSGYVTIVNRSSGKCLDVYGQSSADGANVDQWACNGGQNQQWQWVAHGSYFQIKGRQSGKCLDVNAASTADGANIQIWTCNNGTNQDWTRQ